MRVERASGGDKMPIGLTPGWVVRSALAFLGELGTVSWMWYDTHAACSLVSGLYYAETRKLVEDVLVLPVDLAAEKHSFAEPRCKQAKGVHRIVRAPCVELTDIGHSASRGNIRFSPENVANLFTLDLVMVETGPSAVF